MSKRKPPTSAEFDPNAVFGADLLHVLSDPVRLEILSLLARGPGSASSLAAEMGQKVPNVSYHLIRVLHEEYGFLKIVRSRKGALIDERFFSVDWEKIRGRIMWPRIAEPLRSALKSTAAVPFMRELMRVLEAGTADDSESTLVWHPASVDSTGWDEIRRILSKAQEKVAAAVRSSSTRLDEQESVALIQIQVGFAAFEVVSQKPHPPRA